MFKNLTKRLTNIFNKISNHGMITEKHIQDTLREVRTALLEADVALPVIKRFIKNIKNISIGKKINKTLTPGQELIKIVKKELISCINNKNYLLNLSTTPPAIILIVGLQGMGKTTSAAKLGFFIKNKIKKKVLVSSIDIMRPAGIEQLKILCQSDKIDFFQPHFSKNILNRSNEILEFSKNNMYDVLIVDTSGRMHINTEMMEELKIVHNFFKPIETILVIDSMIGQDSINIAKNFKKYIELSGFIITKIDGDSRGGVAFSICEMTKKPVKFLGIGEKIQDLEIFNSEKIVNRILGMGDVLSIIEEIEENFSLVQKKNFEKNNKRNKKFNLNDFLLHLQQVKKMGNLKNLIDKMPQNSFMNNKNLDHNINSNVINKFSSIILSMTLKERNHPEIIKFSRKKRIALGSGVKIQDINIMLKQFTSIQKVIKKVNNGNITQIFKNIKNFFN
ncbi:signal recognition particle protein [Buchnera aphidicola (Kurisakia onigurumii)]|uniref:signal recognition particle protein n=1 Tax=Buchnera aphidicola TaxID=9 RepID=UPI0031B6EF70